MNYSVFLGADKRYIPHDGNWATVEKHLYDLVFRSHPQGPHWYFATLVGRAGEIRLGYVFGDGRGRKRMQWSCIPNPSHLDKTIVDGSQVAVKRYSQRGFATRLAAAEYLMRVQEFTDPLEW